MKAKDVMKLLGITRQTLHNYIIKGYIKYLEKPNGDYEYNDDDVYAFIGQKKEKNIIFDKLENVKEKVEKSLEELDYLETWESLSDLYYKFKIVKCKYRFSIEEAQKAFINGFQVKKI